MQAEAARRLALYAIFVSGTQRSIRFGDWDTLAVASALAGRNSDATRALLVEIALTSNLDRTCQNALSAYATFGERFRVPVQAMFNRVDSNGRVSPYCEWPPKWNTAMSGSAPDWITIQPTQAANRAGRMSGRAARHDPTRCDGAAMRLRGRRR